MSPFDLLELLILPHTITLSGEMLLLNDDYLAGPIIMSMY
jgi:hypothetical protein